MSRRLVRSAMAERRLAAAAAWLAERSPAEPLLVLAACGSAADDLLRTAVAHRMEGGAAFGWQRATLARFAGDVAGPALAAARLAPLAALGVRALVARVVFKLGAAALGRYAPIADRPGLPLALARTLEELRLGGVDPERTAAADADLAHIQRRFEEELRAEGLADRATVLRLARDAVRAAAQPPAQRLLLLDLPLTCTAERELLAAIIERAPEVLATTPAGDERSARQLAALLEGESLPLDVGEPQGALERLQRHLFAEASPPPFDEDDRSVGIFSAPGESRECVEIARRILREAAHGVPFDRMAILVHATGDYLRHVEEALNRAHIPACFARGALLPEPSGRAFLALLACAAEALSARRFAEYLSLGEVPQADTAGTPPPALLSADRWVPPDEELVPEAIASATALSEALVEREVQEEAADGFQVAPDAAPVLAGTLRAPRRWEQLLNEAAVIGSRERWTRRLDGLAGELRHRLDRPEEELEEAVAERLARELADLEALRRFALPLVDVLAALPEEASWGEWIEQLSALATRALRHPQRVLAALAELAPMGPVGPVALAEVRLVLARRLSEVAAPPPKRRYGAVLVAPPAAARGLAFDVVFVPGLAERLFPRKIFEDPLLPDSVRATLDAELETNEDRVAQERLALRLAVGAARRRVYLSYPRLDLQQARPRVPSFYALEVLRAARGRLPGFDEMARLAEVTGAARLSWPAPEDPADAVDVAEHDLALLHRLLGSTPDEAARLAPYLLAANPHLGRSIRARAQRWGKSWTPADGLVQPASEAREALAAHQLSSRSYSPTALQSFAACPYRFLLYAILKLSPREVPEAIDEMNPLQRGSLVHEVLYLFHRRLQTAALLPSFSGAARNSPGPLPPSGVNPLGPPAATRLVDLQARLDELIAEVAARYRDDFAPAIDRVWTDGISALRADLREWLRRATLEPRWRPWRFELGFGLSGDRARDPQDPHSTAEPAPLSCGILLRGKIDLVERDADGHVRLTDYKTGKARVRSGARIAGGQALQPVLYALAAQHLFPGAAVEGGRLYYCTVDGGFNECEVALDEQALQASNVLAGALRHSLESGFLPAAPVEGACDYCDYRVVCGPYEEFRTRRKDQDDLRALLALRELP